MKMFSGFILVFSLIVLSSCSKELSEPNSVAGDPVNGVQLKSATTDSDLQGNWLFVGYQTQDGIDIDGELTAQENANLSIIGEADNFYTISGKSFINNYLGSVDFNNGVLNLGDLATTVKIDTDEIVELEVQYINSLLSATLFEVNDDLLVIEVDNDKMVFVKD